MIGVTGAAFGGVVGVVAGCMTGVLFLVKGFIFPAHSEPEPKKAARAAAKKKADAPSNPFFIHFFVFVMISPLDG
jgi:hypothetical protein